MALFSLFKNTKNVEQDNLENIDENILRCVYANAKFIKCTMNFFGNFFDSNTTIGSLGAQGMAILLVGTYGLPERLKQLCNARRDNDNMLYLPTNYKHLFTEGSKQDFASYLNLCGYIAVCQELEKQNLTIGHLSSEEKPRCDLPTLIDTINWSFSKAQEQCLSLLKIAREKRNRTVEKILLEPDPNSGLGLEDSAYFRMLLDAGMNLKAYFFSMEYPDGAIFISEELLDGTLKPLLQFVETDINPDSRIYQDPLRLNNLMFFPCIESQHISFGKKAELDGIEGIFVRPGESITEYIDTIVSNLINNLASSI